MPSNKLNASKPYPRFSCETQAMSKTCTGLRPVHEYEEMDIFGLL